MEMTQVKLQRTKSNFILILQVKRKKHPSHSGEKPPKKIKIDKHIKENLLKKNSGRESA